jgi:hypothetical protein
MVCFAEFTAEGGVSGRETRASLARCPDGDERDFVDFENGCPVEGSAGAISSLSDVPSSVSGLGKKRDFT